VAIKTQTKAVLLLMFSRLGRAAVYPARPVAPPINIMITELG